VVAAIELQFAEQLRGWDGNRDKLRGVRPLLAPLLEMTQEGIIEERLSDSVRALGVVEFYRGYVRLKVAIINESKTVITDVSLKLHLSNETLLLRHVEPTVPLSGDEAKLGNINPGDKRTLAFLLDPLICVKSDVDATVTYRDSRGQMRTVVMPQLKAEVVCPILHSEDELNVAMLRELLPGLRTHDSRIYDLPAGALLKKVFEVAQRVVQGHDVRHVRTFEAGTEGSDFHGEAWYAGSTRHRGDRLVIRASVREEGRYLEYFVASSDLPAVTGLLAELGHEMAGGFRDLGIDPALSRDRWSHERKEELLRKVDLLLHGSSVAEHELAPTD